MAKENTNSMLVALCHVTKDEKHREMPCRVVPDLEQFEHPTGGYYEWDAEYKAKYSWVFSTERSLLTEKGDFVAEIQMVMLFMAILPV